MFSYNSSFLNLYFACFCQTGRKNNLVFKTISRNFDQTSSDSLKVLITVTRMAKLIAVCRDEEFPFERRQIPLMIEETLTVRKRFQTDVVCYFFCMQCCLFAFLIWFSLQNSAWLLLKFNASVRLSFSQILRNSSKSVRIKTTILQLLYTVSTSNFELLGQTSNHYVLPVA